MKYILFLIHWLTSQQRILLLQFYFNSIGFVKDCPMDMKQCADLGLCDVEFFTKALD